MKATGSKEQPFTPKPADSPRAVVDVDLTPVAPLIDRIVVKLKPEEIFLFGSRAEGRARAESDYDLLVILPDDAPESDLDLIKAWELTRGLGVPADVVPITRSDFEDEKTCVGTLSYATSRRGMRIYER